MKPPENFISQNINRRLLINDHISPSSDNCLKCEQFVIVITSAALTLCLILLVICKSCISDGSSQSADNQNPNEPKSIDEELASIPVLVYGVSALPSSAQSSNSGTCNLALEDDSCAICLKDYVHGESVRVLPRCKHVFHKECIEDWLQVPSLLCPMCRDRVLDHFLQSTRSDNCRNIQRDGMANPFRLLAFNFGNTHNYASYPSL